MRRALFHVALAIAASLVPAPGSAADVDDAMASHVAAAFAPLAGCEDNALALALALRHGEAVRLVDCDAAMPEFTLVAPPSPALEWPQVTRVLERASFALRAAGLERPTPEQWRIALVGGYMHAAGADLLPGSLQVEADGIDP